MCREPLAHPLYTLAFLIVRVRPQLRMEDWLALRWRNMETGPGFYRGVSALASKRFFQ